MPLSDETILRKYIGGVGLGLKLLLDETRRGQQATDPTSPLILLTGPLAGTAAPGSSNLTVVSLNYDTPHAAVAANSNGYWAAQLKHAGYDALVVTGRSKTPVFLWIDDHEIAIRDATALWGLDTRETERLIRRSLYAQSSISIACVGPAGEAMLPGAGICNDRNHVAYGGGIGAVMGSKRLKAIAVRGSHEVPLKDTMKFHEISRSWSEASYASGHSSGGAMNQSRSEGESTSLVESISPTGKCVEKQADELPLFDRFADAAVKQWTVVPKNSWNCRVSCAHDFHINEGEFAGATASMCGGAERVAGAAAMAGIDDPSAGIVLVEYLDAMGLDYRVASSSVRKAFQLFNRGVLTLEHTEGLDLTWGNFNAARELLDQMIDGRGFGRRVLAKGLKQAARDTSTIQPDFSVSALMSHCGAKDCVERLDSMQADGIWHACLGVCRFACCAGKGTSDYPMQALRYATGWEDFNAQEALRVSERIAVLRRLLAKQLRTSRKANSGFSERTSTGSRDGGDADYSNGGYLRCSADGPRGRKGSRMIPSAPSSWAIRRPALADLAIGSHGVISAVAHVGRFAYAAGYRWRPKGVGGRRTGAACPSRGRAFAKLLALDNARTERPGSRTSGFTEHVTLDTNRVRCRSAFRFRPYASMGGRDRKTGLPRRSRSMAHRSRFGVRRSYRE